MVYLGGMAVFSADHEAHKMQTESLLDTKQAAQILGLHPHTLTQARRTGRLKIPVIRLGHAVRYRVEDLNAFIEANRVTA